MHLHHDKEAFEELVIGAANELHIPNSYKNGRQLFVSLPKKIDRLDIAEQYDLMPFPITTQAIERTLVDKIFI